MTKIPSLSVRIRLTFIVLTSLMFALFWGLIYFAQDRLEVISLEHRLTTETHEYMKSYRQYGFKAALPDPQELDTYWSEEETPDWLKSYTSAGFFEEQLGEEDKHFLVTPHPSGIGWLYVVYQDNADDYLDHYEDNLHLVTFLVGAIFLIAVMAYGLYFVRLLSTPLIQIEKKIGAMSPEHPNFDVDTFYKETRSIEQALLDSKAKISEYFQREQEFSRFSSHELRTPIMVIKGSTDLLKKIPEQSKAAQRAIVRLEDAANQMQTLTEAFLLLGKESIEPHHIGQSQLSERVQWVLESMAQHFDKQDASYTLKIEGEFLVIAPQSFIDIVVSNLVKNAFSYSIGDITLQLDNEKLTIKNQHDGHNIHNSGYGCGLVIVQRICERMGWTLTTDSDGAFFSATVNFLSNHVLKNK
ncbi:MULTISPECIES: sensor histidine kinase [Vibrio]|uniref:histidine kinase n=1 Tax=Vibrio casei TaxID=673372 RepID=A0A368LJ64_9VIBR|nr:MULTISPECIES: HAMP domain-containing sensor histidine kinase [Vibrio]RCS70403.1 sensor histidine kinase [Vibrio casei]SJN20642.1 two-component system sensor protein [Vibrio casei]HBV77045.1 sensor histidine kinase [Vibrio sp.]